MICCSTFLNPIIQRYFVFVFIWNIWFMSVTIIIIWHLFSCIRTENRPQAPEAKSQSIENNSCSSSISAINHAFIAAFFIFNFRTQNRNDMSKKRIDLHKHNYILMMTSPILSAEYNSYETEKIYSFSLAKNPFYQKYNRWWAWMTPARAIVF